MILIQFGHTTCFDSRPPSSPTSLLFTGFKTHWPLIETRSACPLSNSIRPYWIGFELYDSTNASTTRESRIHFRLGILMENYCYWITARQAVFVSSNKTWGRKSSSRLTERRPSQAHEDSYEFDKQTWIPFVPQCRAYEPLTHKWGLLTEELLYDLGVLQGGVLRLPCGRYWPWWRNQ